MSQPTTIISASKSAALTRVLDLIPRGYTRYCSGSIKESKLTSLLAKFHHLYGIGCTPAQRITRKQKKLANCILVVFQPDEALGDAPTTVSPSERKLEWLLLATAGSGLESEQMRVVTDKPRLQFLGYELVRYASRDKTNWTWRRPSAEMADWYALLTDLLNKRHTGAVAEALQRMANQPGFHGVREQGKALFQFAASKGFQGECPTLFYLQKMAHGRTVTISK